MTQPNSYQLRDQLRQAEQAEAQRVAAETAGQKRINQLRQELAQAERVDAAQAVEMAVRNGERIEAQNAIDVHLLNRALDAAADAILSLINGTYKQVDASFAEYRQQTQDATAIWLDTNEAFMGGELWSGEAAYQHVQQHAGQVITRFTANPAVSGTHAVLQWLAAAPDPDTRRVRKAVVYALIGELMNVPEGFRAKQEAAAVIQRDVSPRRF